jgi:hypothetical protein
MTRPPALSTTPARLRTLLVLLVAACVSWGAVGTWTVIEHASAASAVVAANEPLSLDAQQMYRSLSDTDVTATTAFLGGPQEPLTARQRYAADIARAAADLTALKAASSGGDQLLTSALAAVSATLPVYTGYVAEAQADYALGYQLTGGSFMQVASEQMHLTLLPAARGVYVQENASLVAAGRRATGLPWPIVVLVLAVVIGITFYRAQRWLRRRTHRMVNYGLLAASVLLVVSTTWLTVAFTVARADLAGGVGHGSDPAETLAQAGIAVQQARGDEVLNLISRSGDSAFEQDSRSVRGEVGPGPGTLLADAATSSRGEPGARWAAAAGQDATAWYAVDDHVYRLDLAARYAAETQLVIGTGASSSAGRFSRLEGSLGRAIAADQVVFQRRATAGRNAFDGLEAGIAAAALLMAAGCAWGLGRRLGEYR